MCYTMYIESNGGIAMSVDQLQNKIRKGKNALMVDLTLLPELLPTHLLTERGTILDAYADFCREMMTALKGSVPALRFGFALPALLGTNGLDVLSGLLKEASGMGFYVLLDLPEMLTPAMAKFTADSVFGSDSRFVCDGVVIPAYFGSDILQPFLPYCTEQNKDVFVLVRSGNKSASELQDLLAGSRQVNVAAADHVNRFGTNTAGRYKYTRVGIAASATAPEGLKNLRLKYPKLFLLVDGMEYPAANAKTASLAFDKLGHGAVISVNTPVSTAWKKENADSTEFAAQAAAAAERIQKNLNRYITIL